MNATLTRWHRRLSALAGVALLVWAGSGLLHPLMSITNPRPAAMTPPAAESLATPETSLAEALRRHGIESVGYARLLRQDGELLWQWTDAPRLQWQYAAAGDGTPRPDADARRAELLARHFTGESAAAVLDARLVTSFDVDYPSVNRLLPVWRVRFERDDGLTVYVHTGEDRLASLNDRRKTVLLMLFQSLHTWHWLDRVEGLRLSLIGAAVLSVLAMTMLGLSLVLTRRRRDAAAAARRGHRWLAWIVWVPALMLGVSGLFHLLVQTPLRRPLPLPAVAVPVATLVSPAEVASFEQLNLLALPDGKGLWRLQRGETVQWRSATTAQPLAVDEGAVAARLAGLPVGTPATHLQGFSDEYGFANKRLPVWRLEDGERRLFVDVAGGQVVAEVRSLDVLEQRSFSTLHKWQFLDPIGRGPRDAVLASAALLLLVATGLGWRLRIHPAGRVKGGSAT